MILSLLLLLSTDMTPAERIHSHFKSCAEMSASAQNHPDITAWDRRAMVQIERDAFFEMQRRPSDKGISLEDLERCNQCRCRGE